MFGRMRPPILPAVVLALLALAPSRAAAQQSAADVSLAKSLTTWLTVPLGAGREREAMARLASELPGWEADGLGNLVRRAGRGAPRRVVACAMDIPGYVVSQVTEEGYLRLHRAGNAGPRHVLWDQFHEAQVVNVLTTTGPRRGVVAVANGHFSRQHRGDTTIAWVDELWVDVGASSDREVASLGIALLDPVLADRPLWEYEGIAAGPAAGARAGCAAIAVAATAGAPAQGETFWLLTTQRGFGWTSLAGALARMGPVDELTLVDAGRAARLDTVLPLARTPATAAARVTSLPAARVLSPRVRFVGSFVESIDAPEARALLAAVAAAGDVTVPGMRDPGLAWPTLAADTAQRLRARTDGHGEIERTFLTLADLPGVPGHERAVREAVMDALPAWAQRLATVDSLGNVIVAAGPDRDSVLFIAHLDEVAFEVGAIARDGSVTLVRRGGSVGHAWEGQTAILHFDAPAAAGAGAAPPLRGVITPRDDAATRHPRTLTAWFGLDSAALVSRGVRPGLGVTSHKRAGRLAGARLHARGSDDRTGSTALVHALHRIDPRRLTRKVIFAWSVQEEVGLVGARAIGARMGASLARVYSVDTFVSSETPLELPTFAFTRLGAGPVMRGLDDGAMSPLVEMQRVQRAARAAGIPLQVGTTHGATDGSAITPYGVPNVGLSWPGRYSHAPGEVLDLRDLEHLIRLVRALALEP